MDSRDVLVALNSGTLHGKRDFADVIKGTALKMERVFWMTQVGPIKSFKS